MKICTKCGALKEEENFRWGHLRKDGTRGRISMCKSCENKIKWERIKTNPERLEKARAKSRLRAKRNYDPIKAAPRIKQWYDRLKQDPEKWKKWYLKMKYDMPWSDYIWMMIDQEYCCAICRSPLKAEKKGLFVDHDHQTGQPRGLLCNACNTALGYFENNKLGKRAEQYLEEIKAYILQSQQ